MSQAPGGGLGGLLGGLGGLAGGFSNMFGGDPFDPLSYMENILYGANGQGGINASMHKQIKQTGNLYRKLAQQAKGYGKAGKTQINDWMKDTNAKGDQSLAARGLYNTTVTDSEHQAVGAQGLRAKQALREDVMRTVAGYRIGGNMATNNLWSQLRNFQMMPAQAAFSGNQARPPDSNPWGALAAGGLTLAGML